jgi:hypothetical protein
MGVVILTRATSNVRDQATTRSAFAVASPARISSTIMTIRRLRAFSWLKPCE